LVSSHNSVLEFISEIVTVSKTMRTDVPCHTSKPVVIILRKSLYVIILVF